MAPIHRLVAERQRARHEAAGKAAGEQRRQPDALDDRGVFVAGKAEIDHERRGHGARQRVGEFEQHHEGQHGEGQLVAEEILERADRGLGHAREPLLMGMRGFRCARALRLGGDERGDGADQHQSSHGHIAPVPGRLLVEAVGLEAADHEQRAGGGDQHADAIGGDIGGHAGGLLVFRQAFDAEGVDHDVLRRRGGGDQKRAEGDQAGRRRRIAGAEEHDRRHQQNLREHQPAAAAAEPARQQRHVERVGERRPQEFHGVGRADQREQADGAEIDAGFAHPHQERRARQRQRQPGREAEEHDDQHARLEVDRQRVEEGRARRRGVGGRSRESSQRHARARAEHPDCSGA